MKSTRTALISGASSGIGRAIAQRLAREGYRLIIHARRDMQLKAVRQEILSQTPSAEITTSVFDVRDSAACVRAVSELPREYAQVDVLINNAGLARGLDPIDQGRLEDWDEMIDTNLKGLLYVTHALLPTLKRSKDAHILNIGSTAGKMVYAKGNVYCATKAAVDSLTQSMRVDLLPLEIKVTAVQPGAVETEFSGVRFRGDLKRAELVYAGYTPLTADDVADAVAYCLGLPFHVCINDLVITPRAQANSVTFERLP